MPAREPRVPVDARTRELSGLYDDAAGRLERLVRAALERGAQGTASYYASQLQAVRQVLSDLQDAAVPEASSAVASAYSQGLAAADATLRAPAIAFGGVHQQAVAVLADNLVGKLNEAAVTIGRHTDDAFRRAGLRQAALGVAQGSTRKEVSDALARQIVQDGTTDALTGFVDAAGRRWPLDAYARMVARTTVREAVTAGTVNRILEAGSDLVTISSHGSSCEICADYDGNTYSLSGQTPGYEILDDQPPFHPNCGHVLTPAGANLDAFEAGLRAAA